MQKFILFFIMTTLTCIPQSFAGPYDIKDLEHLVSEGNSEEFLKHALDIRPSQRDQIWAGMTQNMGRAQAEKWISRQEFTEKNYLELEKYSEWPVFKSDRLFQLKREEFLLSFFENCLDAIPLTPICLNRIEKFYSQTDGNIDVSVKFFRLMNPRGLSTWDYLKNIARSNQSLHYCAETDIKEALIKKIFNERKGQFVDNQKNAKDYLSSVMDQECWSKVGPALKSYLNHPQYTIHNQAFLFLSSLGELSQAEKDLYYLYFMLAGPVNGETFNLAWTNLAELAEDSRRREKAVVELLKMDPLPGKIFALPDLDRRRIVIDYLKRTIPDYLDAYARACVDYREGRREFKNGNPTLECNELMADAGEQNWVSESLVIRFSGLQKRLKIK